MSAVSWGLQSLVHIHKFTNGTLLYWWVHGWTPRPFLFWQFAIFLAALFFLYFTPVAPLLRLQSASKLNSVNSRTTWHVSMSVGTGGAQGAQPPSSTHNFTRGGHAPRPRPYERCLYCFRTSYHPYSIHTSLYDNQLPVLSSDHAYHLHYD